MRNILLAQSLLKERKLKYTQIAELTGYHPKYLIKLKKNIDNDIDITKHKNKGKKTAKAITNEEINNVLKIQKKYPNISFSALYNKYINSKPKRILCYNTIYKLLRRNNISSIKSHKENRNLIIENSLIIANFKYHNINCYIGLNSNKEIIYINLSNSDKVDNTIIAIENILLKESDINEIILIGKFKSRKEIIEILENNNIGFNKEKINVRKEIRNAKRIINELRLKYNDIKKINEKLNELYKKIASNKIKYNLYREIKAKTISKNICQLNNKRYEIITNKEIEKGNKITLLRYIINNKIKVKYEDKIYNVKINKLIKSIKGKTKYN